MVIGFSEGGGLGVTFYGWREVCVRSGRVGLREAAYVREYSGIFGSFGSRVFRCGEL